MSEIWPLYSVAHPSSWKRMQEARVSSHAVCEECGVDTDYNELHFYPNEYGRVMCDKCIEQADDALEC
jgi:hypothetical protein